MRACVAVQWCSNVVCDVRSIASSRYKVVHPVTGQLYGCVACVSHDHDNDHPLLCIAERGFEKQVGPRAAGCRVS